jgi:uncharacterized protein YciU (UPF0263 family)
VGTPNKMIQEETHTPQYLESPNYDLFNNEFKSVFLAGTITGARDWQSEAKGYLLPYVNILNPRRESFDINKSGEEFKQIEWEYEYLERADIILFWFSSETVAPITLFELGKHLNRDIFVGIDPNYPRKSDVEIQLGLCRQEIKIHHDLSELCEYLIDTVKYRKASLDAYLARSK